LSELAADQKEGTRAGLTVKLSDLCTPGIGVILWGASPLYVESSCVDIY